MSRCAAFDGVKLPDPVYLGDGHVPFKDACEAGCGRKREEGVNVFSVQPCSIVKSDHMFYTVVAVFT